MRGIHHAGNESSSPAVAADGEALVGCRDDACVVVLAGDKPRNPVPHAQCDWSRRIAAARRNFPARAGSMVGLRNFEPIKYTMFSKHFVFRI